MRRHLLTAAALSVFAAACSPQRSEAQTGRLEEAPPAPRQVPSTLGQMQLSFAPVARRASPAVVNIASRRIVRRQVDPYWQMFGAAPRPQIAQSLGSGAIVRADGVIVTNNHVVQGDGAEIVVTLPDRREFPARVLLSDPRSDLAVLKVDLPAGQTLPTLAIDDRQDLQVGDLVLAIGDPFGVGQTVTSGIVSAVNRTDFGSAGQGGPAGSFIQTDAAINPGNSGGPLVDMDGDLIGLNTFILSGSGSSAGVGFAIPAALVRRVVEQAVGGARTFARPWLGARVRPVSGDLASAIGQAAPAGVAVTDVYPGSSADRGGLREGDVITAVDGVAVNDEAALNYRLATERPGQPAQLTVLRDRRQQTLGVRLEPAPERPARDERRLPPRQPLAGVTVINLSPAVADQNGLDPFIRPGPIIASLPRDSFAAQAGFRPGDIVREVNGDPIADTAQLARALAEADGWRIVIERGGRQIVGEFGG